MSSGFEVNTRHGMKEVALQEDLVKWIAEVNERISDTRGILLDLKRRVDNLETMAMGSYGPSPPAAPTAEEAREAFSHLTAASAVVTVTRPELPLCSELNRAASILRAFIEAHDE